ncbi:MAG: response regulator transcription factor [Nitrospinae bacterium]|nr:response regulator transcription factor [Nitrospinota bacterium]
MGLRVLIADDHPVILAGLRKILDGKKIDVVGEGKDGLEALKQIERLKPDLAILDIFMPKLSGLEILRELQEKDLGTKAIILSGLVEKEYLDKVLKYGGKGYLLKDNSHLELLAAIDCILSGGIYISASVTEKLNKISGLGYAVGPEAAVMSLTGTEKQILLFLAEKKTSKEIAEILHVSFRTVQNHRMRICNKLNVRGVNALMFFAMKNRGLLTVA